ncbi:MAG: dTDP-4-dehydrorhamnose 3,5-epimerase [candidate division WS2 bacterium]|nr:dTDP-4-dehydrorhamnose 3,5-epimerase [Candidatus Psychracetigena formicireducens]
MGKFSFTETFIKGLNVIEPYLVKDSRGFFMETYNYQDFKEAGLDIIFVQDNHSKSNKGVLRGLHYQVNYPQGKLIRVVRGTVFDVAVDLRKDSPTFLKWFGLELSKENKKQLYIPPPFAHGFLTLSKEAEVIYKCTDFYKPDDETGIIWNDRTIGIEWPIDKIKDVILSEKDKRLPLLDNHESPITDYPLRITNYPSRNLKGGT